MNCLEKYRSAQVREANRKLRIICESPDESAVHDFRVCIKRLTAFYGFLGQVDENLSSKKLLKPYRVLFKSLGSIRDAHIAIGLIEDLEPSPGAASKQLIGLLKSGIRRDYRRFRGLLGDAGTVSIRLPTPGARGIPSTAISRHKPVYLEQLMSQVLSPEKRTTVDGWHRKRILLKRYRHLVDAFSGCPGQAANEGIMKRVVLLEQLLGDWHDRVICTGILESLPGPEANRKALIAGMKKQAGQLLGTAKIYLPRLADRVGSDQEMQVTPRRRVR
jgi:CHAD domain-containing protein